MEGWKGPRDGGIRQTALESLDGSLHRQKCNILAYVPPDRMWKEAYSTTRDVFVPTKLDLNQIQL